jgi:hypothetical protein
MPVDKTATIPEKPASTPWPYSSPIGPEDPMVSQRDFKTTFAFPNAFVAHLEITSAGRGAR